MTDIQETLKERSSVYGDFAENAECSCDIKQVFGKYMDGLNKLSDVQWEVLDLIATKISRILTGDPNYADNWHDIAGYASIAEREAIKHNDHVERIFKSDPLATEDLDDGAPGYNNLPPIDLDKAAGLNDHPADAALETTESSRGKIVNTAHPGAATHKRPIVINDNMAWHESHVVTFRQLILNVGNPKLVGVCDVCATREWQHGIAQRECLQGNFASNQCLPLEEPQNV